MSKVDDGGPALNKTLRDEFAAAALQGMLVAPDERVWPKDANNGEGLDDWMARLAKERADFCYMQADAMVTARAESEAP